MHKHRAAGVLKRDLAPTLMLIERNNIMVAIGITLSSESCHALAERAERNGFGDITLRQSIEIFLDSVANALINAADET